MLKRLPVADDIDLGEELRTLLDLDGLKDVERRNPLSGNSRKERVAEHSWHLAVAVALLGDHADEEVDLGKAALLAIAHDVVENYVGDTFAFGSEIGDQYDREHSAMKKLEAETRSPGVGRLISYWREYEDQRTPEARFVKGLDALLPIMLNYSNPEHSSWREHRIAADRVSARKDNHGNMGGTLRKVSGEMIADARERGDLL